MEDKEAKSKPLDVKCDVEEAGKSTRKNPKLVKKKPSTDPEDSGNEPKEVF